MSKVSWIQFNFVTLGTWFRSKPPGNNATNCALIIAIYTRFRQWRLLHITIVHPSKRKMATLRVGNTESATFFSGCNRKRNYSNIVAVKVTVGPPFKSAVASVPICQVIGAYLMYH
jgi:heat shock protein HslJ